MDYSVTQAVQWLLEWLSLPSVGLSAIFMVSMLSATLLPMASSPVMFAYLASRPDMYWPAVIVGTIGNTIGGVISYYMGLGVRVAYDKWHEREKERDEEQKAELEAQTAQKLGGKWFKRLEQMMQKHGAPVLLFSWLPVVGDPLCSVGGWMRVKILPAIMYMAIGKLIRYIVFTAIWLYTAQEAVRALS